MIKKGFTLAELLITLGIIGFAASLVAPVVSNIVPDKTKIKTLDYYNKISKETLVLLSGESNQNIRYYDEIDLVGSRAIVDGEELDFPDGTPDCIGLACQNEVDGWTTASTTSKYCYLLNKRLDGEITNNNIINLKDKTQIMVVRVPDTGEITSHDVTITLRKNANDNSDCVYGEEGCQNPSRFRVRVDNTGATYPADPLLEAYLKNPLNMHAKDEDYNTAKSLVSKYSKK